MRDRETEIGVEGVEDRETVRDMGLRDWKTERLTEIGVEGVENREINRDRGGGSGDRETDRERESGSEG